MKGIWKLTALYFGLIAGYILLYVIDLEVIIYGERTEATNSLVEFVYQQF